MHPNGSRFSLGVDTCARLALLERFFLFSSFLCLVLPSRLALSLWFAGCSGSVQLSSLSLLVFVSVVVPCRWLSILPWWWGRHPALQGVA